MEGKEPVSLSLRIEAELAASQMASFMQANAQHWFQAEPIGSCGGMFLVIPPGVQGWQVFALDHQRTLNPIGPPLPPGFVYRVSVDVIEPIETLEPKDE